MLRWLMTVVVSDEEKAHVMRQVGIGKASVSEPLMKRRKTIDDIETGMCACLRDEPGGCSLTGQAVSGVKAARAWSAASTGNGEGAHRYCGSDASERCPGGERERVERQKP